MYGIDPAVVEDLRSLGAWPRARKEVEAAMRDVRDALAPSCGAEYAARMARHIAPAIATGVLWRTKAEALEKWREHIRGMVVEFAADPDANEWTQAVARAVCPRLDALLTYPPTDE